MAFATVTDRYGRSDIDHFYAEGFWRPESLFELAEQQAATRPDKVFVTDGTASLTYGDLRDGSLRLAAGFKRLGIEPGDRVSLQIPSWAEFAQIALALTRIGAIVLPIMPIYRTDEVGYILQNAGVKVAITSGPFRKFDYPQMYAALRSKVDELRDVVVVRGPSDGSGDAIPLESLFVAEDEVDPGELGTASAPDDPMTIVYSSGTTARPKGCLHTANTFGCAARQLGQAFGYSADDVQFNPSPITHTTGFVTGFLLPMLHGASAHLMEAWEPRAALADIAKFHTTAAVTATTFLQMLMDVYDPDEHDPSSMRLWVAAGSPIPTSFIDRAGRMLPNLRVLSLYGRTENAVTATCTVDDDPKRSGTSDGRALVGSDIKVVDEDGAEVPRGQDGDIAYRGPMHMLEYIHLPEETQELFTPDGYSRSGDLGVMDDDGYVRVTGRSKDIVIRGGMNISVRQVEDLLTNHEAVREVAVVGMPDERMGEKVCCFLVTNPGHDKVTLEDLKSYLLEHGLAIQKVPERLEIVTELPMTPTGKIQKHLLRAQIAEILESENAG